MYVVLNAIMVVIKLSFLTVGLVAYMVCLYPPRDNGERGIIAIDLCCLCV